MVEFKDVSVTYATGVDALNNVNLTINDGDFAFVVGPSGAGKSTLIKLVLKEINPTLGNVIVNGYNLKKLKKREIPYLRRTIGFVFQDFRLIPSMTVGENIAFVLRVIDAPKDYIKKRVQYVVSLVGLEDKVNAFPDELSGGEMQRTAIARALVNDPQLIIADEPTGNIDPELSYEIVGLLKEINNSGTTILMVTHEHDLVRHFGGRIININKGDVTFDNIVAGEAAAMSSSVTASIKPAIVPKASEEFDSYSIKKSFYYDDTDYYDDDVYEEDSVQDFSKEDIDTPESDEIHEAARQIELDEIERDAIANEGTIEKFSKSQYVSGVSVSESNEHYKGKDPNSLIPDAPSQNFDDDYSSRQYDSYAGDIIDSANQTYRPKHVKEGYYED